MCYPSRQSTPAHSLDERWLLIEKKYKYDKTSNGPSTGRPRKSGIMWPRLLNRLSFLAALLGIAWHGVLLAQGEYFRWTAPLLIASVACKLLTTAPRHQPEKDARGSLVATGYQRLQNRLMQNKIVRRLGAMHKSLARRLTNDNNYNLLFLSSIIVILPCAIYFAGKVSGHLSDSRAAGEGPNHKKLANDLGKLGAAALAFLLLPVAKHSPILGAVGLSEVHAIRLHICAGCVVLFGGIAHGLYYTYIWIVLKGYKYDDVFPTGECWRGLWEREYDKDCHSKLVNLLGIICGTSLVALGAFSLYWVRRRFYKLFYYVHISVSVILLFGLVMHYNKMAWYLAPSLLCYTASNVPVYVESIYKRWRRRGIEVSRVVCIPDSGGCVEISFRTGEEGGSESKSPSVQSIYNAIGKYIRLRVPEISSQSHPFTIFTDPTRPSDTVRILFRPHGSFTTALSKRMRALTMLPEPTPSEVENHHRTFNNNEHPEKACPKILVNGIRCATSDMFERAMMHDRIVIIAGGVGIVSYISLIHAVHATAIASREEDGQSIMNNQVRALYEIDDDDLEGGCGAEGENDIVRGDAALNQKRIDVHWMSRDDGLIRHVLANYFEPLMAQDGSTSNSGRLSINIVVHHTSPSSTSISRENIESIEPTTWEPGRQHSAGESNNRHSFAFPSSMYQVPSYHSSRNLLATAAYASIVFGGLWIISYCYDNLQEKHVVETRPIAVAAVIILSTVVSAGSYAVVLLGELFYSKLFAYSKLESSGGDAMGNANNEIECSQYPDAEHQLEHFADNSSHLESRPHSPTGVDQTEGPSIMSISHEQGRPDLSAIVKNSLNREEQPEMNGEMNGIGGGRHDAGIFVCGPTAMAESVRTVTMETGGRGLPIYQEVFEL